MVGAGGSVGDYALAMFGNAVPAGATAGGPYATTEGGSVDATAYSRMIAPAFGIAWRSSR